MTSSRSALRTLLTGVAVVIAAILVVRAVNAALFSVTPYPKRVTVQSQARLREVVHALPDIAATPGDVVIATGTSTMMHGFAPILFDEELARAGIHVTSYNAGFVAFPAEMMHLLAERTHDAFAEKGKRAALAIVELSPEMATVDRREYLGWPSQRAILSRPEDLAEIARHSPNDAVRAAALKTIGFERAQVTTSLVAASLFDPPAWWPVRPQERGIWPKLNAIMTRLYRGMDVETHGQEWDTARRGEYRMRFESTEADYADLLTLTRTDEVLKEDLQFYVRCCDVLELHLDPYKIERLVRTVIEFQSFADRVMVVLLPRDARYVRASVEGLGRLAAMRRTVEARTGVSVVDFTGRLDGSDLFDVAHANDLTGKRKIAALLADEARVRWNAPR